jgi:hypothetical protein
MNKKNFLPIDVSFILFLRPFVYILSSWPPAVRLIIVFSRS